ncbi:uncharacterized protein BDZ99DRAFT_296941 [Mytilinidion resinicola]|uniref:RRM domain-containing protein n=1 Tax=Mytilinidion resinicola TaxID=574789 RepID=A0A6A6YRK6_9PEZI|nr:uncharacterized protein BDZ99DRAFT_296941 [Mytilinidion resinicola]KAF2811159.1 hypothetical protein BDZ99DRAFT_296941 [Mytilinidion resinicola]
MLEHPDLDPSGASIRVEFIDPCEASGRRLAFEGNLRVAAKPLEAQVHVQVKFLIAPNWPRPYAPHDNPSITHHEEVGLVLCTSYFAKYAPVFHAHSDHGLQRIDTDTLTYHLELDSVAAAEHLVLHWADPRGRAWLGRQMYISGFAGVYWHVSSITPAGSQQGLALQYPPEDGPGGAGSRIRLFTSQGGPPVHVGHGSTYHPYGSCNDRQFPPGSGGFANPAMQISGVINCGNLAVRRHRGRTWNPHDNTVSFVHILDGTDVRTTIMLRNIPNKMTDMQLLKILYDAGFRGLIDFMYLRMDFKSGANVGYAFFNLTSPIHIIKFLEHFEGRPWPFHTTGPTMKLAEISYATSQGLEALIQKFRNSSVMRELKCCRPKLFYTFQDNVRIGLVGTEVEFPAPDNEQKLERSIQNAQSIGLFPPNGRGGASPNRRDRFSMFDRGTPRDLAAAHYPMAGYGPISPMQFRHANDNHPFGY